MSDDGRIMFIFSCEKNKEERSEVIKLKKVGVFSKESSLVSDNSMEHVVATVKISTDNGTILSTVIGTNSENIEYTEADVIKVINASQLARTGGFGRTYPAQIMSISMRYRQLEKDKSKNKNTPHFIPPSLVQEGVDAMTNWIKQYIENDKTNSDLFFMWLAQGHAGVLAIEGNSYNRAISNSSENKECMSYFEMGGMYFGNGIIDDNGYFAVIVPDGENSYKPDLDAELNENEKSKFNKSFGEFAQFIEGYESNKPFPVCYKAIVNSSEKATEQKIKKMNLIMEEYKKEQKENKDDEYGMLGGLFGNGGLFNGGELKNNQISDNAINILGQRQRESDCSYRAEFVYMLYLDGTINNYTEFCSQLINEDTLRYICENKDRAKKEAESAIEIYNISREESDYENIDLTEYKGYMFTSFNGISAESIQWVPTLFQYVGDNMKQETKKCELL